MFGFGKPNGLMASGKGHLVGGMIFALIGLHLFAHYFFVPTYLDMVIYVSLALMFSVWPDVDIKSIGQKFFYSVFFLTDCYLIFHEQYQLAAYLGLLIILPILAKHRGWTHSIWAMFLIPSPLLLYPVLKGGSLDAFTFSGVPYYASALTGYFSHLFLDGKFKPWK